MSEDEHPTSGVDPHPHEFGETAALSPRRSDASVDAPRSIGPYTLLERIGEGGMGQVWLAEQSVPVRRRVALKLIRAGHYDSAHLQRFDAERQALALMEHPAIAKVFDAGSTPEGQPYFVMEYVAGRPITEYCDAARLTLRQRLELFIAVCEGVQHAHLKAIIHRDLKPSNVLVAEVDGRPAPRIIDFGIAKAVTAEGGDRTLLTEVGGLVGTLGYMSPEQADPRVLDIDTRADVYALGVILYELLTGSRPFEIGRALPLDEILRRLREDDPPSLVSQLTREEATATSSAQLRGVELKQLASLLRGDLDSITMKALARDRERRYATPSELAADIRRYLDNQPVAARPTSAAYRLRKYVRRHRVAVALAGLAVLLAAGFGAAQFVQLQRLTRERDRADRIVAFMTGIFRVPDPGEQRGSSVTAREILDRASQEMGTATDIDPVVKAKLGFTMAQTYSGLGLYARAAELLEQAETEQRRVLGPDSPDTLRTMSARGHALYTMGKPEPSEALLREALAAQRLVLGVVHVDTLHTANYLAQTLGALGRLADAESMLRENVGGFEKTTGPESADTLNARRSLDQVIALQRRPADAERAHRETMVIEERVLGPDHPGTLFSLNGLALAIGDQGRFAESEQLLRELYDRRRRVLGPEHPETLVTLGNLGEMVRRQGRFPEAETMSRELLAAESRLHPDSEVMYQVMETLAVTLGNQGKTGESIELLEKVLAGRQRTYGPDSPQVFQNTMNLAFTLSYAGRHAEARPLYQEVIRIAGKVERRDAVSDAWFAWAMGATLAGEREQAFDAMRRSLDAGFGAIQQLDQVDDLKPLRGDPRYAALVEEINARKARPR